MEKTFLISHTELFQLSLSHRCVEDFEAYPTTTKIVIGSAISLIQALENVLSHEVAQEKTFFHINGSLFIFR